MKDSRVFRIEASRGWTGFDFGEVWEYRELLGFLVWRDVKVRYKQTSLGIAWAVVQPLTAMVLFSVIFGRVAGLPSDGVPYPVFTFAALLPWQLFSSALMSSANSIVGSSALITKVYFPRLIVPIASVAATLIDFSISFLVLLVLMAAYRLSPGFAIVLLPVFVVLALGTALAVGLWASALNVRYRDVQYLMPFMLQIWLLASPVAYSTSLIQSPLWGAVYGLNPIAGIIQGFRWALLGSPPPSLLVLPGLFITAILFAGGLVYFKRTEAAFTDLI